MASAQEASASASLSTSAAASDGASAKEGEKSDFNIHRYFVKSERIGRGQYGVVFKYISGALAFFERPS